MANSANATFSFLLFLNLLLLSSLTGITVSQPSPDIPPAPSPHSTADSPSPSPVSPAPGPAVRAPNPAPGSSPQSSLTPAPTPANSHPDSPPAPSPGSSQSPVEADTSAVSHTGMDGADNKSSGGGMSAGKKAGIALGVIVAACVVVLAGLVYKKRQQNIRRSQFGYAVRRELL